MNLFGLHSLFVLCSIFSSFGSLHGIIGNQHEMQVSLSNSVSHAALRATFLHIVIRTDLVISCIRYLAESRTSDSISTESSPQTLILGLKICHTFSILWRPGRIHHSQAPSFWIPPSHLFQLNSLPATGGKIHALALQICIITRLDKISRRVAEYPQPLE